MRRRDIVRDHGRRCRGRHHFLRHRRRLPAGRASRHLRPYRGVDRSLVGRATRRVHRRDEVLLPAPVRSRGTPATRARTSSARSTLRCAGSAPTTSTSTSCTSWDADTPIDETLQALDDVVRSGKVRYVGCSNFLAYQLARGIGRAEVLGTANFVSVQPRYNLLFRENERELFPLCARRRHRRDPLQPARRRVPQRQAPAAARRPRAAVSRSVERPAATRSGTGTTACSRRSTSSAP